MIWSVFGETVKVLILKKYCHKKEASRRLAEASFPVRQKQFIIDKH